jgi:serine protease Do
MINLRLGAAGLLVTALSTATLRAEATRVEIQRAVDAVYPALVRIHVVAEQGAEGRMQKQRASGSGTIITKDGYVLTNHHVAGRATRIVCRLSDREEVDAELIGTDPLCDLAILKLDLSTRRDPKAPLAVARFGDSDKLKVGDTVLAMGSPAGLSQSVTEGIVANTAMISPGNSGGMMLDGERVGELVRWIGHDAVIFPGNSGGPLVNLKGEIIGVNEVGIGSLGGAIPANLAQAVAKELIAKHSVSRSWIGLDPQPLLKEMTKEKGILVAAVFPDSPAREAGIRPGDFITQVNGWTVPESRAPEDLPVFNRTILTTPVGATLTLKGSRDDKPMTWQVTTIEREPNVAKELELRNWGLTVRDFTRVSALQAHRKNKNGVVVDSVRSGGPCSESKPPLTGNDIITKVQGQPVANVQALAEWTRAFTKGLSVPKPVLVTFERGTTELVTVAKIGPEPEEPKPQSPSKAWMGVETQVLTRDLAEALGVAGRKGVRVTQVLPNSAAEKAGVKVGDLFLKLDGQVIAASTPSDDELFDNLIRQYKVGTETQIEGMRNAEPLKLTLALGKTPKPTSELAEYKDDLFEFSAREMSVNDRVNERMPVDKPGVRISVVNYAGWAALAGLSVGDVLRSVDGSEVPTIADLKSVMAAIAERKPARVKFFVQHGIATHFLELEPKW